MAKDKKGKKDKAEAKSEKQAEREFKFGVEDIAEKLGIKPASVRVQLRNKGIEKAGKSYGWDSKSELNEVIDQIRSTSSDEDEDDEKPAKKSKKDKAKAKKGSSKKKARDEDEDD